MSTYKRWFPSRLVVEGVAIAPGVLLATNHRKRDEKQQQQLELRAWEAEGGNPAPRDIPVQGSLLTETPEADKSYPFVEKRAPR